MSKKNMNQKKSLIFSTAVVICGCIATAIYVNQTMNAATDYKIDLSRMDTQDQIQSSIVNDPELGSGASLARVSGQDVVNTPPETEVEPEVKKATLQDSKIKEKAAVSSESVIMPEEELLFSADESLGWPVAGDVILNYSMDSAVYFATLMQYKYNPAILISAQQGNPVSACAKGQVVKIGTSAEQGNYVVMNLGNGYEVTYGQLENLQVEEGTVVARGQVIGDVAKTTKYYSLEGDHVSLMVTKDGQPVDPLTLLE